MKKKAVPVERYVEQVTHGSHYTGYVTIAGTRLDYELRFSKPIDQFDDAQFTDPEDVIRAIPISLQSGGARIELTVEEYSLFFQLLVELAESFYHNPQTQDSNTSFLGELTRREGPLADFAKVSIGMTRTNAYNFPPEVCDMLSAPKFGCKDALAAIPEE